MKKYRTLNDIRKDPRVAQVWSEGCDPEETSDERLTYWVALKPGFQADPQNHYIIEFTVADCCDRMADVKPWPNDPELK